MNLLIGIHFWEIVVVLVVVLLLFGSRLPSLARSLGRGIVEFKRGLKEPGNDKEDPPPTG